MYFGGMDIAEDMKGSEFHSLLRYRGIIADNPEKMVAVKGLEVSARAESHERDGRTPRTVRAKRVPQAKDGKRRRTAEAESLRSTLDSFHLRDIICNALCKKNITSISAFQCKHYAFLLI